MGLSTQEYWSGLPFPPAGIFQPQGLNPSLLHLPHGQAESGRSPAEGDGNPPQNLCLENPTDREAWWVTVHDRKESDMTEQLYFTFTYNQFSSVAQSCLTLCDPKTLAYQTPPPMGFSRQEYWSGLPLPSPKSY